MLSGTTKLDMVGGKQVDIENADNAGHCLTPRGLQPYKGLKSEDYIQMVRVVFADGSTVECSADHKLVQRTGWIRADQALGKYCLIMSNRSRYIRVTKVEPLWSETGWSLDVQHHEHRFNVNGGIVVGV